ncbi:hypothetical protein PIROE2DRAFT_11031 [Piromyces sp. E2]|nr:hypothetical protein PIROE2DRAFT_11031 [Piromyces sp. E2]|eukprot:OUM62654.1 hypothetical protein PIROE2DRAFT_11031 [Piromyces sp. E2]
MFKVDELLLLENLTYFPDRKPFKTIISADQKTVRDFIYDINVEEIVDDIDYCNCFITGFDFKNIIQAFKNNTALLDCLVTETHIDQAFGGGGGLSCCFISEEHKEAVVAFRGTALNEWEDDCVGANQIDSLQQVNALEWYKSIYSKLHLENYTVTLTGHSKGGNKAKYITILNNTMTRCVSFDGQGFSDKFMEHYKKEIIEKQKIIENHNIDYDYVNVLLNDVGKKTFYVGFNYGIGGFAESHCPNTFFNFKENGEYQLEVNTNGQPPEIQVLDQFINSMIRSNVNEKEKTETTELVGRLVSKAFQISEQENKVTEFINFFCDTVGDEKYQDNTAYIITFCIKYAKENKEFFPSIKEILTHFKADDILKTISIFEDLINSEKLNKLINLSNFLVLHVHKMVVKMIKSTVKKKYNVKLHKSQINKILIIVSMVKSMLKTLELNMDGSDITLGEDSIIDEKCLPENLNVVILAGGLSNERNISLKTGFEVYDLLSNDKRNNVILLDAFMGYGTEEIVIENAFLDSNKYSLEKTDISLEIPDLWAVKKRRKDKSNSYFGPNVLQICKQSDIVFIALHGANGENGKVQAAFELLGIDYTGNDYFSSALSSNKMATKMVMINNNVLTPKGYLLRKNDEVDEPMKHNMEYPVIVKPNNGGIGLGISVASGKEVFEKAVKEAFRWENEIIVEEYIRGREFSVGILDGVVLPIVEVLPLNHSDYQLGLYLSGERSNRCPANIPEDLEEKIKKAALTVYKALNLNSYAGIDFILKYDDTFYCLEVDSQPKIGLDSNLLLAAQNADISFPDFCRKAIELSLLKK